jgi:hypothetical protein
LAWAAIVFPSYASATLYTSQPGAVSPTDGRALGATADIVFGSGTLTITLSNTEQMTGISQGLTDFHFTTSSPLTNLTMTGADGVSWADCTSGTNPCTFTDAAFSSTSYGWVLSGNGTYTMAATPLTQAGIVNANIDASSDGVRNGQHNPWLVGPVVFNFTFSGSAFDITSVAFSFGTDASTPTVPGCTERVCTPQQVPEPGPLALLGIALFALFPIRYRARVVKPTV